MQQGKLMEEETWWRLCTKNFLSERGLLQDLPKKTELFKEFTNMASGDLD